MKFELQADETEVWRDDVRLVEDRRTYPASLILTNQRAVLTFMKPPRPWLWVVNWIIAIVLAVTARARKPVIRHQMRRDRFASVEQGEGRIFVFHDEGEGYAHTSFAIQHEKPLDWWQAKMQQWASAKTFAPTEPAPLPAARLIDR